MTEGIIWKQLLFFAFPLLISNVLQQLYSAVDTLFVGNYVGDLALAAVGSTGALINLFVGFFLGLSAGASVVVAKYFGAGDLENTEKTVHTSIVTSFIAGIVLTILGWALTPALLKLMRTPEDVFDPARIYLQIYFLSMVPMLVYNVGAGIMRAFGNSREPMMILLFSGIFHIFVNYIFIVQWKMGVAGAAYSTGLSQLISAIWVIFRMVRSHGIDKLEWNKLKIDRPVLKVIVKISVPAGIQSSLYALANSLIQTYVNMFGSVAMAGTAAYYRIDSFLYAPMNAIGLAITTFVSQNVGGGKFDRIHQGVKVGLKMSVGTEICLVGLMLIFRNQLLGLFTKNADVLAQGILVMSCLAPLYWVHSITEALSGAIRGAGNSITPMLITLFSIGGFRILWILIMTRIWFDLRTVMVSYPLSWVLCATIFSIYYRRNSAMIGRHP